MSSHKYKVSIHNRHYRKFYIQIPAGTSYSNYKKIEHQIIFKYNLSKHDPPLDYV